MKSDEVMNEKISLISLPNELRSYILELGLITIIENNSILDPYARVENYIEKVTLIGKVFSSFKPTLGKVKIIATQCFASVESSLTQHELDAEFERILSDEDTIENTTKGAALIIAGANLNTDVSNPVRTYKTTPLGYIAETGKFVKLIPLIIVYGIAINAKIIPFGEPAIILATKHNNLYVVDLLMENGADLKAKNKIGLTALDLDIYLSGGYGTIAQLIMNSERSKSTRNHRYCVLF